MSDETLPELLTRLADTASSLADRQDAINARVDVLDEALAQVISLFAQTPVGGPWTWQTLDPYERAALLVEVREWVDDVVPRYAVEQIIHPCWYRHSPVLMEVIAVYVAWRAAYGNRRPTEYTAALASWHDRHWWPLVKRIQAERWLSACTSRSHEEPSSVARWAPTDSQFVPAVDALTEGLPEPLTRQEVQAAVDAGTAEWFPFAGQSARFEDGSWWQVLHNSPDGRYVPRPLDVSKPLEAEWARKKSKTTTDGGNDE